MGFKSNSPKNKNDMSQIGPITKYRVGQNERLSSFFNTFFLLLRPPPNPLQLFCHGLLSFPIINVVSYGR